MLPLFGYNLLTFCVCLPQTQTNMYELVMEMNTRQLAVEQRVDGIEDSLRNLQVRGETYNSFNSFWK